MATICFAEIGHAVHETGIQVLTGWRVFCVPSSELKKPPPTQPSQFGIFQTTLSIHPGSIRSGDGVSLAETPTLDDHQELIGAYRNEAHRGPSPPVPGIVFGQAKIDPRSAHRLQCPARSPVLMTPFGP